MTGIPIEIERKFLVAGDGWRTDAGDGVLLRQGYLCRGEKATLRVRVAPDSAWLTIKGPTVGLSRTEREYPLDSGEAERLLSGATQAAIVEKTRYRVAHGNHVWEIDVFHGDNDGLTVAEVELATEDEIPELPDWLGVEVSHDRRYRNARLAAHPYSTWPDRD